MTTVRKLSRTATRNVKGQRAMHHAVEAAYRLAVPPCQRGISTGNHSRHDAATGSPPAAAVPTRVVSARVADPNSTDQGRTINCQVDAAVGGREPVMFVLGPKRDPGHLPASSRIPKHPVRKPGDRADFCRQALRHLIPTTDGGSPACYRHFPERRVSPESCVSAGVRLLSGRGSQDLRLAGYPRQNPRSGSRSRSPLAPLWQSPCHTHTVGFNFVQWTSS